MKNLPAKKPKNSINPGDIFRLGDHILACGDSTDKELIAKALGKSKIKLICTDPPYGVSYVESKATLAQGNKHKAIANDHSQTEEDYMQFSKKWLDAIFPNLDAKNAFYIFNSDKMLFALKKALDELDFHFSQLLIWAKTQAVVGRLDYLPQHELIAYGWKGRHAFHKSKDKSLLVTPKPSRNRLHPTMKPVGLLRRLILNSTEIGETVYDPFGGSGSTLMACEQTKRRCLMVELEPAYCQVILDRWQKLTHLNPQKL